MTSLLLKTIIRVLIVFLPVISLSYAKGIFAQQPESIVIVGIGAILILGIILVFIWWHRKTRISRSHKTRNIMPIPEIAKRRR
jgi:hypothetical protein